MSVITRGIRNALRSPMRTGAIVLMLAISIGLVLSMLVARSSVIAKIDDIKSSTGTQITITPAGVMGFAGGGDPLTVEQLATIETSEHVVSTSSTLSDQLGTEDTNLESSLELGSFGMRQQRFESSNDTDQPAVDYASRPAPTPRTTVTGTTNPDSVATNGGSLTITDGSTIDGNSASTSSLIGIDLAKKNDLQVGDTFTMYGETVTVSGIFETGNAFQDSGIIVPLATLQNLTEQPGSVTSVIASIDSSENVEATVASLENSLGDGADITSDAARAATTVSSLESIANLATAGVVGAAIADAVIMLLAMVIIVRERRREIGVIKAIGGSNKKIIGQFVSEALTLTTIGALVGIVLGVLVSGPMTQSLATSQSSTSSTTQERGMGAPRQFANQISANATQITSSITPQTLVIAVGITLFITIIGSAAPAWFIAKIRPAEVLRTE